MAAAPPAGPSGAAQTYSILQTTDVSLVPPQKDELWSAWYTETEDTFNDFKSYAPPAPLAGTVPTSGGSVPTLSARQISGQFDDEVAKTWEEDWEDEDVEDTYDSIVGQITRYQASVAATGTK